MRQYRLNNGLKTLQSQSAVLLAIMAIVTLILLLIFRSAPLIALTLAIAALLTIFVSQHVILAEYCLFMTFAFPITIIGSDASFNLCIPDCIAIVIAIALPLSAMRVRRFQLGSVAFPMILYFLSQVASSLLFWEGQPTLSTLSRVVMLTAVAVSIFSNTKSPLPKLIGFLYSYLVGINVLTIITFFTLVTRGLVQSQYTLGINKNSLGPIFGCGVIIAVGCLLFGVKVNWRRTWIIATLVGASIGLIISLSRGGWIATGIGVLFLLLVTRNFRIFLLLTVVLFPTTYLVWSHLPDDAVVYASNFSASAHTVTTRQIVINKCLEKFQTSPVYGVGVGLRKTLEPHNVVILTLAETGVLGLASFLFLFGSGFYAFFRAAKLANHTPDAYPIVVIGAAIFLVSIVHGMMDVYWRRGIGFMGWSCVGMSIYIANSLKAQALKRDTSTKRTLSVAVALPAISTDVISSATQKE